MSDKSLVIKYAGKYFYVIEASDGFYNINTNGMQTICNVKECNIQETIQKMLYDKKMANTLLIKSFNSFQEFLQEYPWDEHSEVESTSNVLKELSE